MPTSIEFVCSFLGIPDHGYNFSLKQVARQAAYEAIGGESMETIEKHIEEHPDVDGIVTGDETRLRQIITNLAR